MFTCATAVHLLICFVCSSFSEPIEIIEHSAGIYFDPTSIVYFQTDNWNVITYVDMINIRPYMENIEKSIENISTFCEKARNLPNINLECKDTINPLEILINSNNLKLESLSHLISDNRQKRALEFGGEILKFFFGTLDADDARKYDEAVSACQQNEHHIYSLMKDNIHVVRSTINSFNVSIQKLNNNEILLNRQIEKLNYIFASSSRTNNNILNLEKINSMFNIIEGSLLSISNVLDTVLNSILFAKANILHPYVITPKKLYNELSNNSQLKRTAEFPVSLTLQNIHTIIDLSKLTVYYYNNKLMFIIQVPLMSPIKFNLYKNLPLPTPSDTNQYLTYVLIRPSKLFVAVTDDRLSYVLLDSISECKHVNSDYILCPSPSILSTINNPSCESKLLTEVTLSLPEICDSKVIYGVINVWQKLNNNRYIYVQSKPNKLTLKCNNNITDYILHGTGILSLENNCVAYFQTLQFHPSNVYKSTVPSQITLSFDLTLDDCCKYNILNESTHSINPISLSNIDLESLKLASHKLENLETEIRNSENQSHIVKYGNYYSGLTYVIISAIILFIIYKLCTKFFSFRNSSCCIQIYNQCYNTKQMKKNNNVHSSIELTEISDDLENDNKSVKSLPNIDSGNQALSGLKKSNRNITNF
ncbi:uncharacterized protein LOC124642906 [Helicoverpa zea]|uniref:uncharacterized protein LOC124642906 n=1 Tax=Helicoverpa zea TaxID=7113 RepID=UPI001F58046D|nr:uncharacterized protein LOC124642906 [Helicoverpa zea]